VSIKPISEIVEAAKRGTENLSVEQLQEEMRKNDDLLVIDLREIQERVDLGAIPGSLNAPRGMLEFWADPESPYYREYFREDRRTVVFCAGGHRSVLAAAALTEMGFQNVAQLAPGFAGWAEAGAPVEDVSAKSRWVRRK